MFRTVRRTDELIVGVHVVAGVEVPGALDADTAPINTSGPLGAGVPISTQQLVVIPGLSNTAHLCTYTNK